MFSLSNIYSFGELSKSIARQNYHFNTTFGELSKPISRQNYHFNAAFGEQSTGFYPAKCT